MTLLGNSELRISIAYFQCRDTRFEPQRLVLVELTPTAMTLQMADINMTRPKGILEDVLIKVGKFIFLVDFVMINIEKDKEIPLLLGRPFFCNWSSLD